MYLGGFLQTQSKGNDKIIVTVILLMTMMMTAMAVVYKEEGKRITVINVWAEIARE